MREVRAKWDKTPIDAVEREGQAPRPLERRRSVYDKVKTSRLRNIFLMAPKLNASQYRVSTVFFIARRGDRVNVQLHL